jgi:quercetin dioxygenase-like cupin family protein
MPEPIHRRPGDDVAIANPVGGEITFMVRGEHTGGRLTALETIAAPGEGPLLHTHAGEDEGLLIVDGRFRFRLGDRLEQASIGSFVYVPRGVPHTWQNIGVGPGRMFVIFTPSGMERFFDAFAALEAPDRDAFAQAGVDAGMSVVGPPLSESHPLRGSGA